MLKQVKTKASSQLRSNEKLLMVSSGVRGNHYRISVTRILSVEYRYRIDEAVQAMAMVRKSKAAGFRPLESSRVALNTLARLAGAGTQGVSAKRTARKGATQYRELDVTVRKNGIYIDKRSVTGKASETRDVDDALRRVRAAIGQGYKPTPHSKTVIQQMTRLARRNRAARDRRRRR